MKHIRTFKDGKTEVKLYEITHGERTFPKVEAYVRLGDGKTTHIVTETEARKLSNMSQMAIGWYKKQKSLTLGDFIYNMRTKMGYEDVKLFSKHLGYDSSYVIHLENGTRDYPKKDNTYVKFFRSLQLMMNEKNINTDMTQEKFAKLPRQPRTAQNVKKK
jgi:hypothetical protein